MSSPEATDWHFEPDVWYNLLVKRMRCPYTLIDTERVKFGLCGDVGACELAQFHTWLKSRYSSVPDNMVIVVYFLTNLCGKNLGTILSNVGFLKRTNIPNEDVYQLVKTFSGMQIANPDSYRATWLLILKNTTFDDKPVLKVEPLPLKPTEKPKPAEKVPAKQVVPPEQELPKQPQIPTPASLPLSKPAFQETLYEKEPFEPGRVLMEDITACTVDCEIPRECKTITDFRTAVKLRPFVTSEGAAKRLIVALFGGRNWRTFYVEMFKPDSDTTVNRVDDYRNTAPDITPADWHDTIKTATSSVAPTSLPEDTSNYMRDFDRDVVKLLPKRQRPTTVSEALAQIVTVYAPNWEDKWAARWKSSPEIVQAVNAWKESRPTLPNSMRILLLVFCRSLD